MKEEEQRIKAQRRILVTKCDLEEAEVFAEADQVGTD